MTISNEEVARAWSYGNSAEARHFYTDGTSIWSYGSHFPIATIKGNKVFMNMDNYSVTTSQHQSLVRSYNRYTDIVWCHTKELISLINNGYTVMEREKVIDEITDVIPLIKNLYKRKEMNFRPWDKYEKALIDIFEQDLKKHTAKQI